MSIPTSGYNSQLAIMWLINTETLNLEYFPTAPRYKYAILSHTWEEEEVLFKDMSDTEACEGQERLEQGPDDLPLGSQTIASLCLDRYLLHRQVQQC